MFKYSQKLLDHFKNPRNYGKIKNPDGKARVGNPICGDVLELSIKVKDNKIVDARFLTFGCIAALGVSSILTEMIKGKTIQEAKKITPKDIAKETGGLPSLKAHCAVLGFRGLKSAIEDYEAKNKRTSRKEM